jgi:hypothetical protein
MNAYDIAQKILSLWSANCNKCSGEILKDSLDIPVYYRVTGYEPDKHNRLKINNVYVEYLNSKPIIILETSVE